MPTVLRLDGLRVVIYPNDHPPAHVHILGPGLAVVVNLIGMELREAIGCTEREARRIMEMISAHQEVLLAEWRRIHG